MADKNEAKTETPAPGGADALARAASQRADRLEEENKKLKNELAVRAPKSKDADVAELRAELERMQARHEDLMNKLDAAALVAGQVKREPRPLEEKFKGTKSYRSTQPHYRQGHLYAPGDIITVTDERPSKHWTQVVAKVKTEFVDVVPADDKSPVPEV